MDRSRQGGPEESPCHQYLGGLPRVPALHPAGSGKQFGFLGTMPPATASLGCLSSVAKQKQGPSERAPGTTLAQPRRGNHVEYFASSIFHDDAVSEVVCEKKITMHSAFPPCRRSPSSAALTILPHARTHVRVHTITTMTAIFATVPGPAAPS